MATRKPPSLTFERFDKLARGRRNSEGLTRDLTPTEESAVRDQYRGGQTWPPTHDEEW